MSELPDETITGQKAADALRLAVRLEASAPVDVTPPDPRLRDEADAEVDRLTQDHVPVADLAAIAQDVGVSPETVRLALMDIATGRQVTAEDASTIALSRRLTSDWLTGWELANRLRALEMERVSLRREEAGFLVVLRFVTEGSSRSPLGGLSGAAQRLGWPRLLATIRPEPDGGSEVVFRMQIGREIPGQQRRLLRRVGVRATLAGAVVAAPVLLFSATAAAGLGVLACAAMLYAGARRRPSSEGARAHMEQRLKAFLQGLE